MNTRRIVLAGGSGFLGGVLARYFLERNYEVVILTRKPNARADGVREVHWDGETLTDWTRELEDADAVINLAGVSVNCRYHERNRRSILDSRVNSTRALGAAIAECAKPPPVWMNSSTATIYRHTFGPAWDEDGEIGATKEAKDGFSVEVACAWERTFKEAKTPATRKVALRTAMVLGNGENSVFPTLRRLVRLGLGGKMASGKQYVSWIHEQDFSRAVEWLMENEEVTGPVNLVAPNPLTNEQMMRTLREVSGARFGLPAAAWMLELGAFFLRTETELIVKSRRVVPRKLLESGFEFCFPTFKEAIEHLSAGRQNIREKRHRVLSAFYEMP